MSEYLSIEYIDVYSPSGDGPINHWVDSILAGGKPKKDQQIYHWVHIRDAESAHRIYPKIKSMVVSNCVVGELGHKKWS